MEKCYICTIPGISMMPDNFAETKTITTIVTDMRKLLSIFMVMLMAITTHAQNNYKLGDFNRDGRVTVADAMMVVNVILNGTPPLFASQTSVTMFADGTITIGIVDGQNEYEVISSNTKVVTASLSGSVITLTAVANGDAKVTVKDMQTMRFLEIPVQVGYPSSPSYLACPDDHHPHLIDLGLPSGTKWACCNVDGDHPENQIPTSFGGYYAWGETETKIKYSWSTYIHCDGTQATYHDLGSDIAGTQYDVAHVKWGGSWVMPSKEQQDELINNCTSTWTAQNGVDGRLFTGSNGASIFLPAEGWRNEYGLVSISSGNYWSSTQNTSGAYDINFNSEIARLSAGGRYVGQSVRPVVGPDKNDN